jgi:polysaccharide biosynthesis/export protein
MPAWRLNGPGRETNLLITLACVAASVFCQVPTPPPSSPDLNLPAQRIGIDDLISVSVYDRPELTRSVRVPVDGEIRLPLLIEPIHAIGLMPADLEKIIASRLAEEEILVRPVVTVAMVEYRSRPVSVVGAVHRPLTFQVSGTIHLLDALARSEGLTSDAGTEILITSRTEAGAELVRRIPVKKLIGQANPEVNILLSGGEEIRVPEASKVYLVGNVKHPGVFPLHDGEDLTVLKVLALSEGLLPFATKEAFVYRQVDLTGGKTELKIPLRQIIERKAADFTLQENDIFYIPDNKRQRLTITAIDRIVTFGSAAGTASIYGTVH